MSLEKQFITHWQSRKYDKLPTPHLLALSGGIDSMALAHLLIACSIPFAVAHCNFGLRGASSDEDEAFVRAFAEKLGIPCFYTSFHTAAIAIADKKGIQETARSLRYGWLEEIRSKNGYATIITAHHASDNAETLLINLLRGSGIRGLHGIRGYHDRLLRPLLFAEKADIVAYATERDITYREDSSNASDKYLRNALRHKVLPALQEVMPDAIPRINESIGRIAEGEILYQRAVDGEMGKLIEKRGADFYIPIRKLSKRQPLHTICYELFRPFGFTSAQIPGIIQMLGAATGQYRTSSTHRIIRNRDFLIVTAKKTEETDFVQIDALPASFAAGNNHYSFCEVERPSAINPDPAIALLDAGRLSFPLILRRWRTGDYFYPIGMGMKKKKLSRFFIDQKLPLHHKEQVWVLESAKRIVWVAGLRLDDRFKITTTTARMVQVEIRPVVIS